MRLDEEVRAIDEELLKAKYRDKFELEQKHAVEVEDLSQHLLQVEPHIVHFSGHGSKTGQIYLEDENSESHPVSERALSNLFSVLKDNIRCVVLNACYSEKQAKAISKHIDCVIGMSKAIGDDAAIKFAQGFYRGIAYGKDLEDAFRLGCAQIDLHSLDEQDTPKIIWKNNIPKKILNLKTNEDITNSKSYMGFIIYIGIPLICGALGFIVTGATLGGLVIGFVAAFFLVFLLMIIYAIVHEVRKRR